MITNDRGGSHDGGVGGYKVQKSRPGLEGHGRS